MSWNDTLIPLHLAVFLKVLQLIALVAPAIYSGRMIADLSVAAQLLYSPEPDLRPPARS